MPLIRDVKTLGKQARGALHRRKAQAEWDAYEARRAPLPMEHFEAVVY